MTSPPDIRTRTRFSARDYYTLPASMVVDTDGAAIKITVGLADDDGRDVTRLDVMPEDETRGKDDNGRVWVRDGDRLVRLHPGESKLPGQRPPHPPLTIRQAALLGELVDGVARRRTIRYRFYDAGVFTGALTQIAQHDSYDRLGDADDVRGARLRIVTSAGVEHSLLVTEALQLMADDEFKVLDQ